MKFSGLEDSGQRINSLNNKTKRTAFFGQTNSHISRFFLDLFFNHKKYKSWNFWQNICFAIFFFFLFFFAYFLILKRAYKKNKNMHAKGNLILSQGPLQELKVGPIGRTFTEDTVWDWTQKLWPEHDIF